MRARRLWMGMGAVLVATAMLVCGSATVASAKSKPLTKAAFIKAADKICAKAAVKSNKVGEKYFGNLGQNQQPTASQVKGYVKEVVPIVRGVVKAIKKLTPPKADKATIKQLLNHYSDALDAIEQDPQLFVTGSPFDKADQAARAYGFQVCGESSD